MIASWAAAMAASPARWVSRRRAPGGGGRDGREHLGGEVVVEEEPAQARASRHRVRPLLPGAAAGAARQVGIERAIGQAGVFAVDPGRDGLTEPVALHAL